MTELTQEKYNEIKKQLEEKNEVKTCIVCGAVMTETKDGKYLLCENEQCPRLGILQVVFNLLDKDKLLEMLKRRLKDGKLDKKN